MRNVSEYLWAVDHMARRGRMRSGYSPAACRSARAVAACKTVVGRRLKCTGMRWSVADANPVL